MNTVVCDIIDCEKKIKEWVESPSKQLLCGFHGDHGGTGINNTKFYQYGKYKLDFLEVLNEIHDNIRTDRYPSNVILSFKKQKENPEDDSLPKWSNEDLDNWGYWYLVGVKI